MKVIETDRLILRRFSLEDAAFVLKLVNDPAWLEHIGGRNVRTLEDARAYLSKGALESAAAVIEYAKTAPGLKRIVTIVSTANLRSIRILEGIGLKFERKLKLAGDDEEPYLYSHFFASSPLPQAS